MRIDSEESSPSNAQNKPEVKQIPCGSRKAGANEENSSVIVIAATEAPVTEVQTPTAQETGVDTEVVETVAEKSSEVSKTAASENTTITPVETVDQNHFRRVHEDKQRSRQSRASAEVSPTT